MIILNRELTKATRSIAKIDSKVGGEFKLLEGRIQGSILELVIFLIDS